jgi:uncharacterized RDD family membrane protein YckC
MSEDKMNILAKHELSESTEYGGFWIRVGAYLIDVAVLLIPVLLISFLYKSVTPASDGTEKVVVEVIDFFLSQLIWWAYYAVLHSSSWQASLGKKALGLKVVDENGERISFGRATGRYFAGFLSAIILCVGLMMVGWTKRKQGLHDMIAGTLVIKVNS